MNSYYEVGVRYDKTMDDGSVRKVTEKPGNIPTFSARWKKVACTP